MNDSPLLFQEKGGPWEPLPCWSRCFIGLGYNWAALGASRSILLVSTPCDSAAAGLIALGAMLRRLEQEGADDLSVHAARLRSLAPENAAGVTLRNRRWPRRAFEVVRDENGAVRFQRRGQQDPERHVLVEGRASDWYFDGEQPIEASPGSELPFDKIYQALLPRGHRLCAVNLRRSDSLIVLAGRSTGRRAMDEILSAIRLYKDGQIATLSQLLAVRAWSTEYVSRVRYFNPRATSDDPFDRPGPRPSLVVADGPGAFEAILNHGECADAHIIAVINRTADPDRLEALAARVEGLGQWYEVQPTDECIATDLPVGVEVVTLERRV